MVGRFPTDHDGWMTQSVLPVHRERAPQRERSITIVELGGRLTGPIIYAQRTSSRGPTSIQMARVDGGPKSWTSDRCPFPVVDLAGDSIEALRTLSAETDVMVLGSPDGEFAQVTDAVLTRLRRDAQCLVVEVDEQGEVVRASGPEHVASSAAREDVASSPSSRVVVVGVDGSPCGEAAVRWARSMAIELNATLRLVGVRHGNTTRTEVERALEAACSGGTGPTVQMVVVEGEPVDQLLSQSAGAELLVVGRHGTSGLVHSALGGVGDTCARLATCPVVIVPS
jgi:nucleotide-binding universal stress UspA family protein